jgi:hypothetical protein
MKETRIMRYALLAFLLLLSISFAETREIGEHKVIKGDTLWDISKNELNDPFLWPKIWKENSWIANPHWIYPNQMIKIPLYLVQKEKSEEEAAPQPAEQKVTLKPVVSESQAPAVAPEQLYKGIKGIVLQNGNVIEGKIIIMNADIVKIRTNDGKVSSYSFIKEVEYFIKEKREQ